MATIHSYLRRTRSPYRVRPFAFSHWRPKKWRFLWCRRCLTRRRVAPFQAERLCLLCMQRLWPLIWRNGLTSQKAPLHH